MSTFPEFLQSLSDDQLRLLIRTRPDAFFPTPPSVGSLATRLGLPGSASRALRQLTAADLAVLERWARRPKSSQALALRCRIVLAAAAGEQSK